MNHLLGKGDDFFCFKNVNLTMRIILYLLVVLFSLGCATDIEPQNKTSDKQKKEIKDSSVIVKTESLSIDSTKIPSSTFLKLVDFINGSDYIHDTSFIHKVGMYRHSDSIINVNGKLFYYLKPEQTLILDFCRINRENPRFGGEYIFKESLYKSAKYVFTYYYREKNMDELVNDGYVEEWYFEDSTQAEKAKLDFKSKNHFMIANTASFGHRKKNKLYIMYTRAAGFGMFLDKIYQHLKALK